MPYHRVANPPSRGTRRVKYIRILYDTLGGYLVPSGPKMSLVGYGTGYDDLIWICERDQVTWYPMIFRARRMRISEDWT